LDFAWSVSVLSIIFKNFLLHTRLQLHSAHKRLAM